MSQSTQDLETRDGLAHGLLQPAEGGTSAPDQVLADLRVANLARAIADGERIAMWALGAEALALVLRAGPPRSPSTSSRTGIEMWPTWN